MLLIFYNKAALNINLFGLMAVIPVFLCASLCWGAFMNACFLYSRDSDFLFTVLEEPMEIFAGVNSCKYLSTVGEAYKLHFSAYICIGGTEAGYAKRSGDR